MSARKAGQLLGSVVVFCRLLRRESAGFASDSRVTFPVKSRVLLLTALISSTA